MVDMFEKVARSCPLASMSRRYDQSRSNNARMSIRSALFRKVKAQLESHGFNMDQMGWKPDSGGKDLSGKIRRHLEGYVNGWITYHRLDDLDAMEVLYR